MPAVDDAGGVKVEAEGADGIPVPAWMKVAVFYENKKVREIRGGENPDIIRFFKEIQKPEFNEDEIPWCAAFVGACLFEANYGHNKSALAAHFGIWDGADQIWSAKGPEPKSNVQYGDIMVMTRNGGGHVCFFIKDNGNGTFKALGGNQNDEVNYSNMSWARTTYGMRPNGTGTPKIRPNDPPGTIGREEIPGHVPPGITEIGVGIGGGIAAFSTADLLTGIVVLFIVAGIIWYIWRKRQPKAPDASK